MRPSESETCTVSLFAPATTWLLVTIRPDASMITPDPSPSPDEVATWIATTDGATCEAISSHVVSPTVVSEMLDEPPAIDVEDWGATSSSSALIARTLPPLARTAVSAAVPTIAGHMRRSRSGRAGVTPGPAPGPLGGVD